jgi:hypothetical protein
MGEHFKINFFQRNKLFFCSVLNFEEKPYNIEGILVDQTKPKIESLLFVL